MTEAQAAEIIVLLKWLLAGVVWIATLLTVVHGNT
jgi:hypothetical protein